MLICTAGEGWYQEEGKEAVSLTPGTVITIPADVKHWHGAKADSWFSHIAVEVPGENTRNEWCEPVTDEEYARAQIYILAVRKRKPDGACASLLYRVTSCAFSCTERPAL